MQFNGIRNEMLTIQMTWRNTQGRHALMGFTLSLYKQFGFVTVIRHKFQKLDPDQVWHFRRA